MVFFLCEWNNIPAGWYEYTHYDKGKEQKTLSGEDLTEAIFILRLLLEYNICLVLGIDNKDKVQDELINYRTWQTVSGYQPKTN